MSDLNRKDFTKKEWSEEWDKRYRQTEKHKARWKRYAQSDKCKASQKRYRQTDTFKASLKRYQQTDTFKAYKKRASQSEKGRARWKRYRQSEKGKATSRKVCSEARARKLNATVSWSDKTKVNTIFAQAQRKTNQTGKAHAVDHIVPLQGKAVCGLHVEGNLRVILASTNQKKHNQFTPTIEQLVLRLMAKDQIKNNVAIYPSITS
jgi:hypothetical protein